MNLLLDTHVVVWWLADDARLGPQARNSIAGATRVFVSPVTPWELEIERSLGKLELPEAYLDAITDSGFEPLTISMAHAVAAGRLPLLHRDPFDRMLIAQAQAEGAVLVSADVDVARYDLTVIDPRL